MDELHPIKKSPSYAATKQIPLLSQLGVIALPTRLSQKLVGFEFPHLLLKKAFPQVQEVPPQYRKCVYLPAFQRLVSPQPLLGAEILVGYMCG